MAITYLERKIITDIKKRLSVIVGELILLEKEINSGLNSMSDADMLYSHDTLEEYVSNVVKFNNLIDTLYDLTAELREYTTKKAI